MTIRFSCTQCSAGLSAPDEAGAKVTCPRCKTPLEVPASSPSSSGQSASSSALVPVDKVSKTSLLSATCPYCDAGFPFPASALGTMYQCPKCANDFPLPLKAGDVNAFLDNIRQERLRQGQEQRRRAEEEERRQQELSQSATVLPQDVELARQGTCPNCAAQGTIQWKHALPDGSGDPNYPDNRLICGHCQWEEGMAILNAQRRAVADMLDHQERAHQPISQRPSRNRPSQKLAASGEAHTASIMMLIGGIVACLASVGWIFACFCWPGAYYSLVVGIMAIIFGAQGLNQTKVPPKYVAIMQIICIINGDILNLVLGIVELVFLNKLEE